MVLKDEERQAFVGPLIGRPTLSHRRPRQFIRTKLTVREANSVLDEAMKHFGWRAGNERI